MKKKFKAISTLLVLPAVKGVMLVGCSGVFGRAETETQTTYETNYVSDTNPLRQGVTTDFVGISRNTVSGWQR